MGGKRHQGFKWLKLSYIKFLYMIIFLMPTITPQDFGFCPHPNFQNLFHYLRDSNYLDNLLKRDDSISLSSTGYQVCIPPVNFTFSSDFENRLSDGYSDESSLRWRKRPWSEIRDTVAQLGMADG